MENGEYIAKKTSSESVKQLGSNSHLSPFFADNRSEYTAQTKLINSISAQGKPLTTMQRKINNMGLELELKGVKVLTDERQELPKGHIIDNGQHITNDSGNLELVSVPTPDRDNLHEQLDAGISYMKEKQDRAIAENPYCEGMYCFRPNAKSVHHFKAHPQLTLELSKDSLAEFSDRSYSGITYRKGLLPMKGEDGSVADYNELNDTQWDSVVGEQVVSCLTPRAMEVIQGISNIRLRGLLHMSLLVTASAYVKQFSALYYKSRFALLPRTSLTKLFYQLTSEERDSFVSIIRTIIENVPLFFHSLPIEERALSEKKRETIGNYYNEALERARGREEIKSAASKRREFLKLTSDVFQDPSHEYTIWNFEPQVRNISIADELNSICGMALMPAREDVEAPVKYDGVKEDRQVDYLSSNTMGAISDVGGSVGAMDLPLMSDGIYEIRMMPFVDIRDVLMVHNLYDDILDFYEPPEK